MNYPKMILFDYRNTLRREPDFYPLRGEEALFLMRPGIPII